MGAHTFNHITLEAETGRSELKASLIYIMSPRTARATDKPYLRKNKKIKKKNAPNSMGS